MAAPPIPPPITWPLLPVPDEEGRLRWPETLEQSVEQSLRVILSTRPGEQLMRPDFGAGLDRFLHEPDSLLVRRRIRDAVVDSLSRWEPRVVVDRVDVAPAPGEPTRLRVEIAYRLRRTGEPRRLGLALQTGA
ncbi:GPW/gp25 family protein [Sorangium sp. So ce1128]